MERLVEVERAMMEKDRRVLGEAGRVIAERQARVGAMRVERERQGEAEQRAAKEEAVQMEAERQADAMKHPLDFGFRLYPIKFSLGFSFRLCKIDFSLKVQFQN